jgi:hypothetical protein
VPEKVKNFLERLKSMHQNVHFTMEKEGDGKHPFLAVCAIRYFANIPALIPSLMPILKTDLPQAIFA